MMDLTAVIGPAAGLAAAACWAVASVWYARVPMGAGALTTFKNSIATVCMLFLLAASSFVSGQPMFQASREAWWDICLSGVIGLCLADIAYFRSIQILGARRGLTLTLLTPPVTALLGQLWLGEYLGAQTWGWIALTLVGIGIVMRQRAERNRDQDHRPGSTQLGVACSLVGIVSMAIGSVIMKRGLTGVGAMEATFMRLLAASVVGLAISVVFRQLNEIRVLFANRVGIRELCAATLLGTVLGVCLMLLTFKHCPAGIAATLTSTTPLFVIPVVYLAYREKITWLAILGALVAFGGVCGLLLTASQ